MESKDIIKSIELFNEFRERSKKDIIETYHSTNNVFNITFVGFNENEVSNQIEYYIKFLLNNKEYTPRVILNKHQIDNKETLMKLLYEKVSEIITTEIINAIKIKAKL